MALCSTMLAQNTKFNNANSLHLSSKSVSARRLFAQRVSVAQPSLRSPALLKPLAVADFVASPRKGSAEEELTSPITMIHSPQELDAIKKTNSDKLVILECKATGCHPCKKFQPKFVAAARHYSDAIFLEVIGNESPALRNLMKDLKIKSTPSFVFYRNGELIHQHGGANEKKLHDAAQQFILPTEAGFGAYTLIEPDA